jgi:hypothetical protein
MSVERSRQAFSFRPQPSFKPQLNLVQAIQSKLVKVDGTLYMHLSIMCLYLHSAVLRFSQAGYDHYLLSE